LQTLHVSRAPAAECKNGSPNRKRSLIASQYTYQPFKIEIESVLQEGGHHYTGIQWLVLEISLATAHLADV
jgi:hypothetical protein